MKTFFLETSIILNLENSKRMLKKSQIRLNKRPKWKRHFKSLRLLGKMLFLSSVHIRAQMFK
jgi:hypothetical protein